jgi:hypothetical protein
MRGDSKEGQDYLVSCIRSSRRENMVSDQLFARERHLYWIKESGMFSQAFDEGRRLNPILT